MRTIQNLLNVLFISFLTFHLSAQTQNVGIGTLTPDPSAALHITGEDQGLLIPYSEVGDVINPALGLLFFSPSTKSYYSWTGTEWVQLLSEYDSHWTKEFTKIYSGNGNQVVIGGDNPENFTDLTIVHDDITGSGLKVTATNSGGSSSAATLLSNSATGSSLFASSTGNEGIGVFTLASGNYGIGIYAQAYYEDAVAGYFRNEHAEGTSLKSFASSTNGTAIEGIGYRGGKFSSGASTGKAIDAFTTGSDAISGNFVALGASGKAVYAVGSGTWGHGVQGVSSVNGTGVQGQAIKETGLGGHFSNLAGSGTGLLATANEINGTAFEASGGTAGYFISESSAGMGVNSETSGVTAISGNFLATGVEGIAVRGEATGADGYAGYFKGNVETHVDEGGDVVFGLKEGAGYGFEFRYDGADDDLELWSTLFSGNTAARMTWKKDGNVGIGTTLPNQKLHVNGNIRVAGSIFASCGTLTCSDARYKTEVEEISSALENIQKLTGVYYMLDTENFPDHNFEEGRQVGVIAQELEKVYPELVITGEDGYKSVAYDKLGPILMQAIKELKQNQSLIEKNQQSLEARFAQLEVQMEKRQSDKIHSSESEDK